MTVSDIIQQRLENHWLLRSPAQSASQVVHQLLAVQAQDYLGALWALGQRIPKSTEQAIEASLSNGTIIRTWPMRGTLHFVCAEDARWLVSFLAPRVIPKTKSIFKKAGLDEAILKKSARIVTKALENEPILTRKQLYAQLDKARISTDDTRGLHITGHLAMNGLICFGPRKGKEQTFVLMDQWLRTVSPMPKDEILPTLALRYFQGHGPATVRDFSWWTGLTLTEARQAISQAGNLLVAEKFQDDVFYQCAQRDTTVSLSDDRQLRKTASLNLLPAFDEFTVAYKDRELMLPRSEHHRRSMEVLSPVMTMNGMVVGTWRRSLSKNGLDVHLQPFTNIKPSASTKFKKCVNDYEKFLNLDH